MLQTGGKDIDQAGPDLLNVLISYSLIRLNFSLITFDCLRYTKEGERLIANQTTFKPPFFLNITKSYV